MSSVYSIDWTEHRARFQGRVSTHERRVLTSPPVRDTGINLSRPRGVTGYQAEAVKRLARQESIIVAIENWTPPPKPELPKSTGEPIRPSIREIKDAICAFANVSNNDLISDRRSMDVVKPRQIGMLLSKLLTTLSLPCIGREFGGRDHTTVLHAVRKLKMVETFLWKELKPETPLHLWVSTAFEGWKAVGLK